MKKIIRDNQLLLKKLLLIIYDIIAVSVSGYLALLMRFELEPSQIPEQFLNPYRRYNWIMIIVTILVFYVFRLYSSLWTYAGAVELINVVLAGCVVGGFQIVFYALIDVRMPRSYWLLFTMNLIVLIFAGAAIFTGRFAGLSGISVERMRQRCIV